MAQLLRVQTNDGLVLVEVSPADNARQVSAGDKVSDVIASLSDGMKSVVAVAREFAAAVVQIGASVKKAEMELGLEVSAEGKFFIASAGAKATFSAKLEFDLTKVK
jgi:hypothetical protein